MFVYNSFSQNNSFIKSQATVELKESYANSKYHSCSMASIHHHHHLSLNCEGRWGTTDDFTTCFLHFSLFSTALWDLANYRPLLQ